MITIISEKPRMHVSVFGLLWLGGSTGTGKGIDFKLNEKGRKEGLAEVDPTSGRGGSWDPGLPTLCRKVFKVYPLLSTEVL